MPPPQPTNLANIPEVDEDNVRRKDLPDTNNYQDILNHIKNNTGDNEEPTAILVFTKNGEWKIFGVHNKTKPKNAQGNSRKITKGDATFVPPAGTRHFSTVIAANFNPITYWIGGTPYIIC